MAKSELPKGSLLIFPSTLMRSQTAELRRLRLCPSGLNIERKEQKWRLGAEQPLQCLEEMNISGNGQVLVNLMQVYHDFIKDKPTMTRYTTPGPPGMLLIHGRRRWRRLHHSYKKGQVRLSLSITCLEDLQALPVVAAASDLRASRLDSVSL